MIFDHPYNADSTRIEIAPAMGTSAPRLINSARSLAGGKDSLVWLLLKTRAARRGPAASCRPSEQVGDDQVTRRAQTALAVSFVVPAGMSCGSCSRACSVLLARTRSAMCARPALAAAFAGRRPNLTRDADTGRSRCRSSACLRSDATCSSTAAAIASEELRCRAFGQVEQASNPIAWRSAKYPGSCVGYPVLSVLEAPLDYKFDVTATGRTLKFLHIVDEFTRESLSDLVACSLDSDANSGQATHRREWEPEELIACWTLLAADRRLLLLHLLSDDRIARARSARRRPPPSAREPALADAALEDRTNEGFEAPRQRVPDLPGP
jgi:hypothetical protein